MTTIILSITIFLIVFIAMMVGVIFGRTPIQGSCGGIGNQCGSCSKPCKSKERELQ